MTIQEQIKALMATRKAKAERAAAIMAKAGAEGRSTDSAEAEEFDEIDQEIKQLDADIARLKRAEEIMVVGAQAPAGGASNVRRAVTDDAAGDDAAGDDAAGDDAGAGAQRGRVQGQQRGPTIIVDRGRKAREDKFLGQSFTRLCIAHAAAHIKNHAFSAAQYAEKRWGKAAEGVVALLRAGVTGGGTLSGQWGAELLDVDSRYRGDFIEFLYSMTVYDRLPLRVVPANVTIKGQDGAATGYWVGQKAAIPASAMDFSSVTLSHLKVGALAALSNDIIMYSDPSAEMMVRDGIGKASSQRVDTTFLSSSAAVSNVSPAGILNGVTALTAGGEDAESLYSDIGRLYAPFISAKNATDLAFVMYTGLAKSISLMRNALGQKEFPDINIKGGMLEGDPVYTGENVAADDMILLKPSDIWRIGDSGFEVAVSKEATIEMDTAPTGEGNTPTAQSANMVSMFQNEMTAFKVVRHINFAKRRSGVVQYVGDATYNGQQT